MFRTALIAITLAVTFAAPSYATDWFLEETHSSKCALLPAAADTPEKFATVAHVMGATNVMLDPHWSNVTGGMTEIDIDFLDKGVTPKRIRLFPKLEECDAQLLVDTMK